MVNVSSRVLEITNYMYMYLEWKEKHGLHIEMTIRGALKTPFESNKHKQISRMHTTCIK